MRTLSGLDVLRRSSFQPLVGRTIAALCNQASIAADLAHIVDLLLPLHRAGKLRIARVFGPQHGLGGHTQDNMVEWEGGIDARTGLTVRSLYGATREPSTADFEGVDLFAIDLQDVGARYYTFTWTMALCLSACEAAGVPAIVLDRPNPIGADRVEGPVLQPGFESFVGLYPLPIRHGMTLGEIATHLAQAYFPRLELQVVRMEGYDRAMRFAQTGLPWAMPSPNMPTPDTAMVYPGMCLLEGSTLSEGRGTTRPFETFGAPGIDGRALTDSLNALALPGAAFRAVEFQPTFQKHSGKLCEGCAVHVLDQGAFEPVMTGIAVLVECFEASAVSWTAPPYEYETVKPPIDILAGNDWVRKAIESSTPLAQIRDRMIAEVESFEPSRRASLLYGD